MGRPMPRLTYSPSSSSRAARAAIWSRVQLIVSVLRRFRPVRVVRFSMPLRVACLRGELDDALHEDARQVDVVGADFADLDDLLGLDDR